MKRSLMVVPAVLVLAGIFAIVQIQGSAQDRDWSAIAPVVPDVQDVPKANRAQRVGLAKLDTCAVLRRIDPAVERTHSYGHGCRTFHVWDQLRVEVWNRATDRLYGPLSSYAFAGTEFNAAGFTAWRVEPKRQDCSIAIPAGPAEGMLIRSGEMDCDLLVRRTVSVLREWRKSPGKFTAGKASSPPFTAFGMPTVRGVGACVDLEDQSGRQCVEVEEVAVPNDPVDLIRHGEADPAVLCAAAVEVARDIGISSRVRAVTALVDADRGCVLLVGEREGEIRLKVSREPLRMATSTTIAGHPARPGDKILPSYQVALTDPGHRGMLEVWFEIPDDPFAAPEWADRFTESLVAKVLG